MTTVTANGSHSTYTQHSMEIIQKRIASLQYLKEVQGGTIFWLNTIHVSSKDYGHLPPDEIKNVINSQHLFVLGGSIPNILTNNQSLSLNSYLASFAQVLKEYSSYINPSTDSVVKLKSNIANNVAHASRKLFKTRSSKSGKSDSRGEDELSDLASVLSSQPSISSHNTHHSSLSNTSASSIFESVRSRPSSVIATAANFASFKSSSRSKSQREKSNSRESNYLTSTISNTSSIVPTLTTNTSSSSNNVTSFVMSSSGTAGTQISGGVGGLSKGNGGTIALFSDGQITYEDYPHLIIHHLPFTPDMYETFQSTCDVLIDAYRRIEHLILLSVNPSAILTTATSSNTRDQQPGPGQAQTALPEPQTITHESFALLVKLDELVKNQVITPTIKGIDTMSKTVVYEETKRLDNILRDTH